MNVTEHLLVILGEECVEVSHRVSKALRFGLSEAQPGQASNLERLEEELVDLFATVNMLYKRGLLNLRINDPIIEALTATKQAKVARYMGYSRELGTLEG